MPRPWRLLVHQRADGPWNMGVDEALLASAAGGGIPVLRLYEWDGAWLSLGYAQSVDERRLAACGEAGVGVVRRATGGRAVLHGRDLTYALAAPAGVLPAGVIESSLLVSGAIAAALEVLGAPVERAGLGARGHREASFDCFAGAVSGEVRALGRKLVGSAQRRVGAGTLQHGSLRLRPDPAGEREAAGLVPGGATSLAELGLAMPTPTLRRTLVQAFASAFGASFTPSELTPSERQHAAARRKSHRQQPLLAL